MNELIIHTISDLQIHVRHHGKVPIQGFDQIYAMALQDLLWNPPFSFKDHKKAKTPYHSRYGERWVDKLKSSTVMSKLSCITDLIRFMMNEAEKLMKRSLHEENFYIFHYDLVLMKANEKINWMKQKGYLHRWLLPLNEMQNGTPYVGRSIRNSPKFMPFDNSLNRYILHSLCFHCVLSHFIVDREGTNEEEINLCFSFSTPTEIAQVLKHIWDSKMRPPSSARIFQDVDLALKVL